MHKKLNSVKGGITAIADIWRQTGGMSPMKLPNMDNATAAQLGDAATKECIERTAKVGAVPMSNLAGSIFNNKDKRKGQQNMYRDAFSLYMGFQAPPFPDTSNTQYQSHCKASADC
jgi:hypothetical protein